MTLRRLVMITLAIALAAAAINVLFAGPDQVTLCHRPIGNPANAQTITVVGVAVPAHLGHGDTLGPCPISPSE